MWLANNQVFLYPSLYFVMILLLWYWCLILFIFTNLTRCRLTPCSIASNNNETQWQDQWFYITALRYFCHKISKKATVWLSNLLYTNTRTVIFNGYECTPISLLPRSMPDRTVHPSLHQSVRLDPVTSTCVDHVKRGMFIQWASVL